METDKSRAYNSMVPTSKLETLDIKNVVCMRLKDNMYDGWELYDPNEHQIKFYKTCQYCCP